MLLNSGFAACEHGDLFQCNTIAPPQKHCSRQTLLQEAAVTACYSAVRPHLCNCRYI